MQKEIQRPIQCINCKRTYLKNYYDFCPKCNMWTLYDLEKKQKVVYKG